MFILKKRGFNLIVWETGAGTGKKGRRKREEDGDDVGSIRHDDAREETPLPRTAHPLSWYTFGGGADSRKPNSVSQKKTREEGFFRLFALTARHVLLLLPLLLLGTRA